jgi:hypothetical protein
MFNTLNEEIQELNYIELEEKSMAETLSLEEFLCDAIFESYKDVGEDLKGETGEKGQTKAPGEADMDKDIEQHSIFNRNNLSGISDEELENYNPDVVATKHMSSRKLNEGNSLLRYLTEQEDEEGNIPEDEFDEGDNYDDTDFQITKINGLNSDYSASADSRTFENLLDTNGDSDIPEEAYDVNTDCEESMYEESYTSKDSVLNYLINS